jgi:NAD(P)-dependent dehydrogenase (short-subunit alcohol dehydrogenase family)
MRSRAGPGQGQGMDSYVVTGAGRGVGRAIAERLLANGAYVVIVERDAPALAWTREHPAAARLGGVAGDAADQAVAGQAADLAQEAGTLAGWVNNAAVFRDAWLHATPAREVLDLIAANLSLAVTGCATAVGRFLDAGTPGAIVNVSSHQAQRPVRGALPYATAKAAIEGLTRALAVDYGPRGIRSNAVALGSIATPRYEALLAGQDRAAAARIEDQVRELHPLGRPGSAAEAAAAVAYLLSADASFVNGVILAVDGGRGVLGLDPEQA